MRFPDVLESADYGNPEVVLERRQAREANEQRRGKRRTLHVKPSWSAAREAAEKLFDFAGASDLTSSPRGGAMPLDPVRREELIKP